MFFKELVINQTKTDETGIRFPEEQSNNVSQNSEEIPTFLELPKQASNDIKGKTKFSSLYAFIVNNEYAKTRFNLRLNNNY